MLCGGQETLSFPGSASHKAQTGLAYDGDDNDNADFGNSGDDDNGSFFHCALTCAPSGYQLWCI